MAKKSTVKPAARVAEVIRVPVGVYATHSRETAIVIKHGDNGVWFLTMRAGYVECLSLGPEHFLRDFPLRYEGYPILRAIRKYESSGLRVDPYAAKVMHALIENLDGTTTHAPDPS